jgi:hypothetical protein
VDRSNLYRGTASSNSLLIRLRRVRDGHSAVQSDAFRHPPRAHHGEPDRHAGQEVLRREVRGEGACGVRWLQLVLGPGDSIGKWVLCTLCTLCTLCSPRMQLHTRLHTLYPTYTRHIGCM